MRNLFAVTLVLALPLVALADKAASGPLSFTMKGIDGKDIELSKFKGKVVLFVNVASRCGLTPQYEALQALHEKYNKDGLVIVGVPANEFGKQEPGTDLEISRFCSSKYGVSFVMLSKVVVKGKDTCPLYTFLTSEKSNPKFAGDIKWNFTKFLVGRDGTVVGRFEPRVKPDSREVLSAIETELKKK